MLPNFTSCPSLFLFSSRVPTFAETPQSQLQYGWKARGLLLLVLLLRVVVQMKKGLHMERVWGQAELGR